MTAPARPGYLGPVDQPPFDYLAQISQDCAGLAAAAEANLGAVVVGCPGWSVADLVAHLIEVQWFWATIAEERLQAPPDDSRTPPRPDREQLIPAFRSGASRLVRVLRAADQADPVWTWAPAQRNVAFITRHQVQEAAVHHWDAVHAAGGQLILPAPVAVDCVSEFLTFSVSSAANPADPPRPALAGSFALRASGTEAAWTVHDGESPGTVAFQLGAAPNLPAIDANASDLLLWLYRRVEIDPSPVAPDLAERFLGLCFTD